MEQIERDGGGEGGVVTTVAGDQLQVPRGSDASLGGGESDQRRISATGEVDESGSSAEASNLSATTAPGRPTLDDDPPLLRVVREPELVMEDIWLPWCQGRGIIEFAASLKDLSTEIFEV